MPRYEVVDSHTGAIRGRYSNRRRAQALADRLDLVYGAVRFAVRFVEA